MSGKTISKFGERVLFSRLKKKDKEAFIQAYDLFVDDINRFIYFKIGDHSMYFIF